jgi:hypothetical protein
MDAFVIWIIFVHPLFVPFILRYEFQVSSVEKQYASLQKQYDAAVLRCDLTSVLLSV